jgi:hypothetical protein
MSQQELYRMRRLQNVSGPGVAVSSRGISISEQNTRRPIPSFTASSTTAYSGPWKAGVLASDSSMIEVGSTDDYGIINHITFGGVPMMVNRTVFNTSSLAASGDYVLYAQVWFHFNSSKSDFQIGHAELIADTQNISFGGAVYPNGASQTVKRPDEVSNVHVFPICAFTYDKDTLTASAVTQVQQGAYIADPATSYLAYDGDTLFYWFYATSPVGSQPASLFQATEQIPANYGPQKLYSDGSGSIYDDPNAAADSTRAVPICTIATDGNGRLTLLRDHLSYTPYNLAWLDARFAAI